MNLENAKVALSYSIAGAQLLRGDYTYAEKTQTGEIIPENQRLRVKSKPFDSPAKVRIILSEQFVNHAISDDGYPRGRDQKRTKFLWNKMGRLARLKFSITQFVNDRGATEFEYSILSE